MTHGLVSITRDGKVICKVVVGCDGYNADKLARWVSRMKTTDPDKIYIAAEGLDFGCRDCLVVQLPDGDYRPRGKEELSVESAKLYRDNFDKPHFNPRWKHGTVEHYETVEIGDN